MKDRIVLLGFLSHFPVAGVAWQTVHYLVGLQRLGYDVYYVESHGCTASKLMQSDNDDGPRRAAEYIERIMRRFGFENRWCYHAFYESRCFGMSEAQLKRLYRDAALIINLHGSHLPTPELTATNRLVYLETDPVDVQIDLHNGKKETLDYLSPHCAFFTFGENIGNADCCVPAPQKFKFLPTRQPVVMDLWENAGNGSAEAFTTIGNWRQPWREIRFNGEIYTWSKHLEFEKFIMLPSRVKQPFELALSSYDEKDKMLLESKGWRVRHALEISEDLDFYRDHIGQSRGEFTVAKDQNVRLRSGWFSDRAVTYLAAGRPVITQETGFSNILPTGEGLFAFSKMDEIVAAVEAVNADYERHRRAAFRIARECFAHDVVLKKLLDEVGISKPKPRAALDRKSPLPENLVLAAVSRWPTRLPDETVQTAMALPISEAMRVATTRATQKSASIVVVTHNGLAYTKMCLASLFASGWNAEDELIIVDNASTDGTADFLRELAKRNSFVRIILNERNLGFAAANNIGLLQARGDALILLNNDTIVLPGWRGGLLEAIADPAVGLAGPVTNRTCNEAQIDAPYRTHAELEKYARGYTHKHAGEKVELQMVAMFCMAMRRDVFEKVGPLDEQFEVGMFEDDDYSRRVRQAGYKIFCVEDVFVHHFGQASFGELCLNGQYDQVLEANRRRFEAKWKTKWQPHGRRITPEYQQLRQRIHETISSQLPAGATIAVVSKGDEELVRLNGCRAWHFPQASDGGYANIYPADSAEALAHLESLRANGVGFFVIPKPGFWWLDHYAEFKNHLDQRYKLTVRDEETCFIYDLRNS